MVKDKLRFIFCGVYIPSKDRMWLQTSYMCVNSDEVYNYVKRLVIVMTHSVAHGQSTFLADYCLYRNVRDGIMLSQCLVGVACDHVNWRGYWLRILM